ncbi:hypothetical protein MNBD_GAMMA24-2335 [hydrothermal vent metagenome]|uniref:Uncharacterized protein n=1 Tax=hydrothermal vent metagenome TaxID=652676 RepID=A0A3B1BMU1_9ZZZZ
MVDRFRWFIPALLVVFSISLQSEAAPIVIRSQDWAMPRSAAHLLSFPPLALAVGQLRLHPDAHLLIHYPGGDEGTLWVNELQSWLVALGVSSELMERIPGSSRQTVIEIEVVSPNGKNVIKNNTENNRSAINQ